MYIELYLYMNIFIYIINNYCKSILIIKKKELNYVNIHDGPRQKIKV